MTCCNGGLIPHFTKDLKAACKPINARSETAASLGMLCGALERCRCLVAMLDTKQLYAIDRKDGALMAFAGVWKAGADQRARPLRSSAILTTTGNASVQALHDRMSVILEDEHWPVCWASR